ncbi:WD-40 repeat protein [Microseira wollei NIES-4236]|uniref:WD-40 repeat protein n=1 Tax=Microseira wollei NIES-4236 TaxID=2530354 RepID=A0AAV3XE12_9CYAN|nr:WD-40 repeat protein [Microseira wollei NIES-4236]
MLLWGSEFAIAQKWWQTALAENKQPAPTALQQTFIEESHKAIVAAEAAEKQRQAELLRLQEEKTKEAEARLAEQKKSARLQQRFLVVATVLGALSLLGCVVSSFMYIRATQSKHQAKEATAEALAKSSVALFADNKKLDALLEALRAKQALQDIKGVFSKESSIFQRLTVLSSLAEAIV